MFIKKHLLIFTNSLHLYETGTFVLHLNVSICTTVVSLSSVCKTVEAIHYGPLVRSNYALQQQQRGISLYHFLKKTPEYAFVVFFVNVKF